MTGDDGGGTNPYASPEHHDVRPRAAVRNRAALAGFVLTLLPPLALLLAPVVWMLWPEGPTLLSAVRWLLFLGSPAAVFAVAFGIIGLLGRPSGYSMFALVVGGAECFAIILTLMLTL